MIGAEKLARIEERVIRQRDEALRDYGPNSLGYHRARLRAEETLALIALVKEYKAQAEMVDELYAAWHEQDVAWLKYEESLTEKGHDEERAIMLREAQDKGDKILAIVEKVCRAALAKQEAQQA